MRTGVAIAALLAATAGPARADLMRARDVVDGCDIVSADEQTFARCMSYIQGLMDGFYRVDQSFVEETNTRDGFLGLCLPKNGVRGDVLVEQVKSHIEKVPRDAGVPARTVIFALLQRLYPCTGGPKP